MPHTSRIAKIASRVAAVATVALLPAIALAQADSSTKVLGDTTIEAIVGRLIGAALGLMGTISLAVFMWSGFTWMTAGGNGDKVKKATHSFAYAAIGLIVCFSSYAILRFVLNDVIGKAVK